MKQLELSVTTGSLVTSVTESGQLVGIPKLVSYLITVVSDIVLIYYHNTAVVIHWKLIGQLLQI